MVVALVHKVAFSGLAGAIAAGASLVTSAVVEPAPYGTPATKLEINAAGKQAARLFDRADMNKDGALDGDEYSILTVVSAELAQVNGFVAIEAGRGVEIIPIAIDAPASHLTNQEKALVRERAAREFRAIAGDDERLSADEFIGAQLEQFLSSDKNRDGVLAGGELSAFAFGQSRLSVINS